MRWEEGGGGEGSVFVFNKSKLFEFLVEEGGNYYFLRIYIYI